MREKTKALAALMVLAALLVAPLRADETGPLKIFILAGQSNMVGSGQSDELRPEYLTQPRNVLIASRTGKLVPLRPQGRFGPEVSFSHAMAKAWPDETIVIVKHAVGGTSALAWSPTWSAEKARSTQNDKRGPLYDQLMSRVKALLERGDVEIVAMLWAQGGRDARYEEAANAYKENLQAIVTAVRRDVGIPDLPFLLAQTVDAPPRAFPHIEKVRAAQQQISKEVARTRLVSSDRLAKHRDNIHFNTEGQIELGKRFAKAFLEMEASAGALQWLGTWQADGSKDCKELRCQARQINDVDWQATFTGVCSRRFSFQVAMKGRETGGKIVFHGKTDLGEENGGVYSWSGQIVGESFTGKYESTGGKKGTFGMQPHRPTTR